MCWKTASAAVIATGAFSRRCGDFPCKSELSASVMSLFSAGPKMPYSGCAFGVLGVCPARDRLGTDQGRSTGSRGAGHGLVFPVLKRAVRLGPVRLSAGLRRGFVASRVFS